MLGVGTSAASMADVSGAFFTGASTANLYGPAVPLDATKGHFFEGTQYNGEGSGHGSHHRRQTEFRKKGLIER
jgi:hypothetical protein